MPLQTITPSVSGYRSNWLPTSQILIFSVVAVAMPLSARSTLEPSEEPRVPLEPLRVTADYPKGCNGGPGPKKGGENITVLEGTCIYSLRGHNTKGEYQESAGLIARSNVPGKSGVLRLQYNIFSGDAPIPRHIRNFTVNVSGLADLQFENDGIYIWWEAGGVSGNFDGEFGRRADVEVPSKVYVRFPGGDEAYNEHYALTGWADSERLRLFSNGTAKSNSSRIKLFTGQSASITQLEEGWNYEVYAGARGFIDEEISFRFAKYVANGTLYG
ncbi:hypothetical protein FOZ63_024303 [Perkinsus olseni]|uniref:Uncharacterized protein n=1 Tax=Perkinsus olseni TaxID=32597 RepID=A0A7J6S6G9_PEROL|nr:hypothetical protein FOZ63_024303 [Perkinsus olseni]